MTTERVLVSWSGGKDSAMALSEILADRDCSVAALLTTVTEGYDRISMHGVRRALLERQAASLGLPLETVLIPRSASNEDYEARLAAVLSGFIAQGVATVVYGDLFLEDLRTYRENWLARLGMKGRFPIWRRDTQAMARSLPKLGYQAITTCVDTRVLDGRFVGRVIDPQFLDELPPGVDPCGENGEFHSFVFDGPIFQEPVPFSVGETVRRDEHFLFCDLVPA